MAKVQITQEFDKTPKVIIDGTEIRDVISLEISTGINRACVVTLEVLSDDLEFVADGVEIEKAKETVWMTG